MKQNLRSNKCEWILSEFDKNVIDIWCSFIGTFIVIWINFVFNLITTKLLVIIERISHIVRFILLGNTTCFQTVDGKRKIDLNKEANMIVEWTNGWTIMVLLEANIYLNYLSILCLLWLHLLSSLVPMVHCYILLNNFNTNQLPGKIRVNTRL